MIKRLLIVMGIIAGIAIYAFFCNFIAGILAPTEEDIPFIFGILCFFFMPIVLAGAGWILYFLILFIFWICTGKTEISFESHDDIEQKIDPDEQAALRELNKEFPGTYLE